MKTKGKILFISHDASRTGAPILLLNLARLLKENSEWSFSFILKRGGVLTCDFEALSSVSLFYKPVKYDLISRVKRKLFKPADHYNLLQINWSEFDVVFTNTLTNGDILPIVQKYFKGPIISYIHELEMAAQFFTDEEQVKSLIQHTTHFLVPSFAVQSFLENKFKIRPDIISVLPYYIPGFTGIKWDDKDSGDKRLNEFIVGGAGTIDWRKSPDLFIQIAAAVNRLNQDARITFIWKGSAKSGVEFDRLNYDIRKCGLVGKVILEEAGDDMDTFFNKLDIFLLTSREDPYPLVVLEAADTAVPTICFAGAGGAPEFVGEDAGTVVPFLDVQAADEAIVCYYNNPALLHSKGRRAKEKVFSKHQDKLSICKQFDAVIQQVLSKNEFKANSHIPTPIPSHS